MGFKIEIVLGYCNYIKHQSRSENIHILSHIQIDPALFLAQASICKDNVD